MARVNTNGEKDMRKIWINYWIDVGTGLAGLLSALSGLVFLWPGEPTTGILGLSYRAWNSLHTWSSLAAILGVGIHLTLHWNWIVAMTRQGLGLKPVRFEASGPALSRRAFLTLGGAATLVTGAVLAGYKLLSANRAGAAPDQTATSVACPFGLVNDPYPGRCPRYTDADGDGLCDYSVPGSGESVAPRDGDDFWGGTHRRRGWSHHDFFPEGEKD